MTRRRLTKEELSLLKFEDCRACKLVLTSECLGCESGESFEDADEPEDVFERMNRWG